MLFLLLLCACGEESSSVKKVSRKVISSTKQLFSTEAFAKALMASLPIIDTTDSLYKKQGLIDIETAMRYIYQSTKYRPVWVEEKGVTVDADQLIQALDSLRWDGIEPDRYHLKALSASLDALKKDGDLDAVIAFDTACTRAYLQASRDLLLGAIAIRSADSLWHHSNDTIWSAPQDLIASISAGTAYMPLSVYRSAISTYALLRREYERYYALSEDAAFKALKGGITGNAVPDSVAVAIISRELPWIQPVAGDDMNATRQYIRGFQEYYGLVPTGKADSSTVMRLRMMPDTVMHILAANMERLRWMPRELEQQHVLVEIPLMELFYRKDGGNAYHARVVVGKPSRQTPVLNAAMSNIVFSPSWGVPPTILKNDVLPGLCRRGGAYLARKGLTAYDRRGHKVAASAINTKNIRRFSFRQPPGARNALGEVKFNLPNKWDIYLHDTPHREDFPKRYRAKSSGCVRIDRPKEFAEFILSDIEGRKGFDQCAIDSIVNTRKTRFEPLKNKIPIHIIYLTAFEDSTGSHIRLLPDIYGKDKKLMAALTRVFIL